MFQSPTSAVVAVEPAARGRAQPGQPVELVGVVRVVGLAAVGDVERPDAHPAAGGADRAGLRRHGVAPPGHVGEADLDVLEADARQQRDAVPLVEPGDGDVVAEGLQAHQRQLVLTGLGLLQGEHVDVVSLHERLDAVDAGAEGVDVPGRDAHPSTLRKAVRGVAVGRGTLCAGNSLQIGAPWGKFVGTHLSRELVQTLLHPCRTLTKHRPTLLRTPRWRVPHPPSGEKNPHAAQSTRGDRPQLRSTPRRGPRLTGTGRHGLGDPDVLGVPRIHVQGRGPAVHRQR